jgi:hypothetical protein
VGVVGRLSGVGVLGNLLDVILGGWGWLGVWRGLSAPLEVRGGALGSGFGILGR